MSIRRLRPTRRSSSKASRPPNTSSVSPETRVHNTPMWTRRLRSISAPGALAWVLFMASPAHADGSAPVAGVAIDRVVIPGLHVRTRKDRAPDRGGITLAYADDQNEVRVLVRIAVAPDAAGARAFAERVMRGVSGTPDPNRFVVEQNANVAYAIDVLGGPTNAGDAAPTVKRPFVPGAPTFPRAP